MSGIEKDETPQWLVDAFESLKMTESLCENMQKAGRVAYAIARMRVERERIGFVPLPFGEYLEGLATLAAVSLSSVLLYFGIGRISRPNLDVAKALGRLAQMLGFDLEEFILHLRVGIAEEALNAPLPMVAAHRGASSGGRPQDCDRFLKQIECRWPADLRVEMNGIVQAAAASFRECLAEHSKVDD